MTSIGKLFIVLVVCTFTLCASVAAGDAATIAAASASYTDVSAAVSSASRGDTVTVPAGDGYETWANQLAITKGITLKGPGSDNLTITNTSGTFIIDYTPDSTSRTNNTKFEVSGFTFSGGAGIQLYNRSTTVCSNILIHDNVFTAHTGQILNIDSMFGGVFYNNTATTSADITIEWGGAGRTTWDNFAWSPALATAFYVEDNTLTSTKAAPQPLASSNGAYPYVVRYNDIIHTGNGNLSALFDIHGNQGTGNVYSGLGAELYGNDVTKTFTDTTTEQLYHRGGTALYFYNKTNGTGYEYIQDLEMVIDSENPTTPGSYPSGDSQVNGQPQHISESYYWNNRGASGVVAYQYSEYCGTSNLDFTPCNQVGSTIASDSEFWKFVPSGFNGTTGVGCGTLGARPATCTTGVGYWATNQSCSDLTNLVGVDPSTPISGTLYKCTSTDTWTPYYTPSTYPHPLTTTLEPPSAKD